MWNFECELISRKILLFWQIFEKKSWNTILRFHELFWPLFQFTFMANLTVIITPFESSTIMQFFLKSILKCEIFTTYTFLKKWNEPKNLVKIFYRVFHMQSTLDAKRCNRSFVIWGKILIVNFLKSFHLRRWSFLE